jgi:uncharacterized protein (TIGR03118 family)
MKIVSRLRSKTVRLVAGLVAALLVPVLTQPAAAQGYLTLNLVSSTPGQAIRTDSNLIVPWGIAASGGSPWWTANAFSGTSTLFNGFGKIVPLVVTVPPAPGGAGLGSPTGIVFNGTQDFMVSNGTASGPGLFIFATLDGTIQGWSPAVDLTSTEVGLDNSMTGAVYTGLAIGSNSSGNFLFAADYGLGTVDMIDSTFTMVGSFTDPTLPAGFAPFGIQNINGNLYVTFAQQNFGFAPGTGFVDVFDTTGALLQRLVANGPLFAPWGLAMAPANFGQFSGDLLVGNLADGHINAFDPSTGAALGWLTDRNGNAITIPDLWGIGFGNGHGSGQKNALYFASGAGVFGVVYPRGIPLH